MQGKRLVTHHPSNLLEADFGASCYLPNSATPTSRSFTHGAHGRPSYLILLRPVGAYVELCSYPSPLPASTSYGPCTLGLGAPVSATPASYSIPSGPASIPNNIVSISVPLRSVPPASATPLPKRCTLPSCPLPSHLTLPLCLWARFPPPSPPQHRTTPCPLPRHLMWALHY